MPTPFVLPTPLYPHLQQTAHLLTRSLPPSSPHYKSIPPQYHTAYPLSISRESGSYGLPSSLYSTYTSAHPGPLVLRRFDTSPSPKICAAVTSAFRPLRSPHIVPLHTAFVHNRALFFAHSYIPHARTLRERYVDDTHSLPEHALWSYLCQLLLAARAAHAAGLALRCVSTRSVLRTPDGRVRVGGMGIRDVLSFEDRRSLPSLQEADVRSIGLVCLSIGGRRDVSSAPGPEEAVKAGEAFQSLYSSELYQVVVDLAGGRVTAFQAVQALGHRMANEVASSHASADAADAALQKEYESGRSARVMTKLLMVLERSEVGVDERWSETGDRYVLKLFRDYAFHQSTQDGPSLDLGHVVQALNKLDAMDDEEVCLVGRDGQSILVVSFKDVAVCLEGAWAELCGAEGKGRGGVY